jgi:polysaccharide export outer membrane protein
MVNLLLAALFLVQAAAPSQSSNPSYVVGTNDVLAIKVFDEPQLSDKFTVDSDGSITYTVVGRVMVGGKTVREIEEHLTRLLADGFLNRPRVSVEVSQYRSRSIFVLGEVRTPGKYQIDSAVTLLEVIANAGSLTAAAGDTIIVRRQKDPLAPVTGPTVPGQDSGIEIMRISYNDLREGKMLANIALQDGDTLFVPEAERFYINGYVRTPGSYVIKPGLTVQQAISLAGGLTERGTLRRLKIIRKDKDGKEVEIDAKGTDLVRPNDTIKVSQRLI